MTEDAHKHTLIARKAGYRKLNSFQETVIPAALENRYLIAETEKGCGKTFAIAVPIILQTDFSYSGLKSLIITSSAEKSRKLNAMFRKLFSRNITSLQSAAASPERNIKKDYRLLQQQPDIFIGTPDSIIDHIRSGNINLEGLQSCVIEDSDVQDFTGFEKDIEFILSKLDGRQQFMVFTGRVDYPYSFYGFFKKPAIIRLKSSGSNMKKNGSVSNFDVKQVLEKVREYPDIRELSELKKIIRKNVPFLMRGFFSAYLLRMELEKDCYRKENTFTDETRGSARTVFINTGKNRGLFARDISRLIVSGKAAERKDILNIKVLDNYSFVEIANGRAADVIETLNNTSFRGKKLAASFARNKKSGAAEKEPSLSDN